MRNPTITRRVFAAVIAVGLLTAGLPRLEAQTREEKREQELQDLQKKFEWWPTDATPGPVKDEEQGGYWWWPTNPGEVEPWGNRGYIYVYKIIFDYKEEELPPPQPHELRPSLLIKNIIKNVKIYFDYDKADLRADHTPILDSAVKALRKNPEADILLTGNCDQRGSEAYNLELGRQRAEAVSQFMVAKGIDQERIRIVSRGKLDAVAPIADLVGMQKDRNAQFMVAEVEEVMIPYPGKVQEPGAVPLEEGKYLIEQDVNVESQVQVSTREYEIQKNDSLWKIAQEQMGSGYRWKYLYELNKDRIDNPDQLTAGAIILIPVEQAGQGTSPSIPAATETPQEEPLETTQPLVGLETEAGPGPENARSYTIQQNDSLWKISQKELGDGNRWREIYELNQETIANPDSLTAGQIIKLPSR